MWLLPLHEGDRVGLLVAAAYHLYTFYLYCRKDENSADIRIYYCGHDSDYTEICKKEEFVKLSSENINFFYIHLKHKRYGS